MWLQIEREKKRGDGCNGGFNGSGGGVSTVLEVGYVGNSGWRVLFLRELSNMLIMSYIVTIFLSQSKK